MSEITLKNVSKIYENQQYAVRNVNLEIQDKYSCRNGIFVQ